MKLSILICSLQKRLTMFSALAAHLEKQAVGKPVEILWLGDNKTMSVGEKRNKLISLAKGDYICFIDDDDWVADDYVEQILQGIEQGKDCICFNAIYTADGAKETPVHFSVHNILNVNEPGKPRIRVPNHLIPIRREFVLTTPFLEKNFGEDTDYSLRIRRLLKTEYKIDKALYHYRFSTTGSETNMYGPSARCTPTQTLPPGGEGRKSLPLGGVPITIGIEGYKGASVVMDIVMVSDGTTVELMQMTQKAINSVAADNVNIIVLEKSKQVKYANADTFLQKEPFNYNQCLNDGAMFGNAEFICFTNNDVVFSPGFVQKAINEMNNTLPIGEGQGGACDVLSIRNQFNFIHPNNISGFCFIMRRSAWVAIGKLNTDYKFWCADDVTNEQIKQHKLKHGKSGMQVFHGVSVTLKTLDARTREEYTKGCVRQFNRDYGANVMGLH